MTHALEQPAGTAHHHGAATSMDPQMEDRSPGVSGAKAPRSRRVRGWLTADWLIAVAVWLMGLPLAVLLVGWLDLDPFTVAGVVMPIGVGCLIGAIVLALVLRRSSARLIGLATGVYSTWIALTLATTLHGTPYGFGGLGGDAGRFVASAMKYMHTSRSADTFVAGLPTEYPPLYPWIVGHLARLADRPAWQLFGEMQIVVMSGSIVVAYVLWRRLVSPGIAFTIVALAPAVWAEPSKDYEFIALLVFAPWVIATFVVPRARGGLHWLAGGLMGGLLVVTYQAWLLYSSIGLLVLMALMLRSAGSKGRYLLHLLGVAVTAFVVASWYVIPFVSTMLTHGGTRISDFWMSSSISERPLVLPFMEMTPIAVVELVGLLGMIWYRRTTWWAQPLLVLVAGNYAYRVLFLLKTVQDNHTGYLQYTQTLISMLLLTAGVLTAAEAAPGLWRRFAASPASLPPVRPVAVTGVAVLVAWAAMQGWQGWVPGPRGLRDSVSPPGEVNLATAAHTERLPDGSPTRFAPEEYLRPGFPTREVEQFIGTRWDGRTEPVVLAYDQRLYSLTPLFGYTAVDRLASNTLLRWDDRAAEIRRLAGIKDPSRFAAASRDTAFGPIDVFVLRANAKGWRWRTVNFSPQSFNSASFHIKRFPNNTVVAVRK